MAEYLATQGPMHVTTCTARSMHRSQGSLRIGIGGQRESWFQDLVLNLQHGHLDMATSKHCTVLVGFQMSVKQSQLHGMKVSLHEELSNLTRSVSARLPRPVCCFPACGWEGAA
jgi:hypothetical protein